SFLRLPFWAVFAVFFPAVTGILSGLSLSGDLKDPARSIPRGTVGAVLISYVIYMSIPLFLTGLGLSPSTLIEDAFVMQKVARWDILVMAGLWGAALSSAVGSILGAPRTLQALARDHVVPKFLSRGYGPKNEPHLALFLSALIGLSGILAGSLDSIATLLTMFFLTTYGLLNLSAAVEGMIQNPSWRPAFRSHWIWSLIGAIGCLSVMFLINAGATLIAVAIVIGIFFVMQKRGLQAYWGDMRYAIHMLMVRVALYRLTKIRVHEKSWRPNILVLSGSPASRWHLIALADALSHGKGFLTVAALYPGDSRDEDRMRNMRQSVSSYLAQRHVPAIVEVKAVEGSVLEGARQMVLHYGFGPLVPNTVLLGLSDNEENRKGYTEFLMAAYHRKKNIILIREGEHLADKTDLRIDVWWRRGGRNAGLMLALAYQLMTSPEWRGASVTLKTLLSPDEDQAKAREVLQGFLREARIDAGVEFFVGNGRPAMESLREHSQGADFVFLGLRAPEKDESSEAYAGYYTTLTRSLAGFPATALVLAAEDVDFQRIFELHRTAM
ncbi:MAG: amino acid permease, partial [Elusimicrobia bacterium]|nr:amino acid permease [Elusimicrobiota bacterium]